MAKAFRFRLEALLRLRRHREEEKRRVLAEALRKVGEVRGRMAALLREEEEEKKGFATMKSAGQRTAADLRLREQYLVSVERRIRGEAEALRRFLQEEVRARHELAEARKRVRVLERLKERRQEEHAYALGRSEQKDLDEVATQQFRARAAVPAEAHSLGAQAGRLRA